VKPHTVLGLRESVGQPQKFNLRSTINPHTQNNARLSPRGRACCFVRKAYKPGWLAFLLSSCARSLVVPAQIDLSRHQVRMQTVLSGTLLIE
jgi:hypothetical protein